VITKTRMMLIAVTSAALLAAAGSASAAASPAAAAGPARTTAADGTAPRCYTQNLAAGLHASRPGSATAGSS
jgi:hypothetical protein